MKRSGLDSYIRYQSAMRQLQERYTGQFVPIALKQGAFCELRVEFKAPTNEEESVLCIKSYEKKC